MTESPRLIWCDEPENFVIFGGTSTGGGLTLMVTGRLGFDFSPEIANAVIVIVSSDLTSINSLPNNGRSSSTSVCWSLPSVFRLISRRTESAFAARQRSCTVCPLRTVVGSAPRVMVGGCGRNANQSRKTATRAVSVKKDPTVRRGLLSSCPCVFATRLGLWMPRALMEKPNNLNGATQLELAAFTVTSTCF